MRAIFENGAFRPLEAVDLPEGCQVTLEIRPVEIAEIRQDLDAIHAVMSERYNSGEHDVAARHNEHQP